MSVTDSADPFRMLVYVYVLFQARWKIIACSAVCFTVAVILLLLMGPRFSSTAVLAIAPPPFKIARDSEEIAGLMPTSMHIVDYEEIATSDGTFAKVQEKLLQSGKLNEQEAEAYSKLENLAKSLDTRVEVLEKTAYGTVHSQVISLSAKAKSPETAALVANTWAEVFQGIITDFTSKSKQESVFFLGGEYDDLTDRYEAAEDALRLSTDSYNLRLEEHELETNAMEVAFDRETDRLKVVYDDDADKDKKNLEDELYTKLKMLKSERQLERKKADIVIIENVITEYEEKLNALNRLQNEATERIAALNTQISAEPERLILSKAITDEALWEQLQAEDGKATLPESLGQLRLRDEILNPVHQSLLAELALAKTELSVYPQQIAYLQEQVEANRAQYQSLYNEIHQIEYDIDEAERQQALEVEIQARNREDGLRMLEREREDLRKQIELGREREYDELQREMTLMVSRLAREVIQQKTKYDVLASKFLSARLAMEDQTTDLVQVGTAVPNNENKGSPRSLLALAAGFMGLVFACAYVLLDYLIKSVLPKLAANPTS